MESKALLDLIAKKMERSPGDVGKLLDGFVAVLEERCDALDSVAIPGFGTFEAKKKTERVTVNPASGKKMLVPPKIVLTFKPSALLKSKLRQDV